MTVVVWALAAVGAIVVGFGAGLPLYIRARRMVLRNLPRVLPITVCPICGRWSSTWCNRVDWYGDGFDCDKKKFKRMNLDGSLRRT